MRWLVLLVLVVVSASPVVPAQELVIAIDGSKEYHRPACPLIQGRKDVLALQRGQAEARGLKPHRECDPANAPTSSAPAKPVMVTVDAGGKFYHRDDCKRIGRSPRKITLDDAAKQHWPCTTCKPPIRPRKKAGDGG
jgi:hypothetical protein